MSAEQAGQSVFPLRGGAQDVVLEEDRLLHPRMARGWGKTFTRYDDVTHVALSERFVWIASLRGLGMISRRLFSDPADPERLLRVLVDRLGARPGGPEQLTRMAEIDRWGREPAPPLITRSVGMLCAAVFFLQVFDPRFNFVAVYAPALVADGDWWRPFTANLLHAIPLHFALNMVGLLIVGRLAERVLGHVRTLCVVGVSGLVAMAASTTGGQTEVMGASGIVMGLAGSVLVLEALRRDQLPAWWRFPTTLLWLVWVALLFEGAMGFALPFVAGEAHLAGFLAGALTTAVLTRGEKIRAPESRLIRNAAALTAALGLVSLLGAAVALYGAEDYVASHAQRLVELPGAPPDQLNNQAWMIAIDPQHTRAQLKAALLLAERAVEETQGEDSTVLDTLAEVQFQLGRSEAAVLTIDLAIERAPNERHYRYYREQRRRFTGDRAATDRPEDPNLPPAWREEPPSKEPDLASEDGLRV